MVIRNVHTGYKSVAADFARRNIILLLSVISFFVIGFDLTTEIAESNNEVELCMAILTTAIKPDKPVNTIIKFKEFPKQEKIILVSTFPVISEEYSDPFLSRPPPVIYIS